MRKVKDTFYVGWGKIPQSLRLFLAIFAVSFVAMFAVSSFAISSTQSDPGEGAFMGQASAIGILQASPYPMLHVIESDRFEKGDTIILTGVGKRGVIERAAPLDGQVVRIAGLTLKRGDLNGMQLRGGKNGLRAHDQGGDMVIASEPLGRWRLAGEITDGKCLNGAMRPGTGMSHKACANLCLIGGAPPIFVSSSPVAGSLYLLMADENGNPVTSQILDYTATYVDVEGDVERRGDLLIFKITPQSIRVR